MDRRLGSGHGRKPSCYGLTAPPRASGGDAHKGVGALSASPAAGGTAGRRRRRMAGGAPGYTFEFPRDHAAHPEFKIEWWYYTGNLDAADGRRFGYQVTFFRVGIDPAPSQPVALGRARPLHDARGRQRSQGPALPFRRAAEPRGPGHRRRGHRSLSRVERRLGHRDRSTRSGVGTAPCHAPLTHSRRGRPRRGPHAGRGQAADHQRRQRHQPEGREAGNASHYYSLTRMPTRGTIVIDGERIEVTGSAGWTASSARASSSRINRAGTGSRFSCRTAAT
jgi:hypothetical protein